MPLAPATPLCPNDPPITSVTPRRHGWLVACLALACTPTGGHPEIPAPPSADANPPTAAAGALPPADATSARLCVELVDDDLSLRIEATQRLQERFVGFVTGGTEEQMSEAARWCETHHGRPDAAAPPSDTA